MDCRIVLGILLFLVCTICSILGIKLWIYKCNIKGICEQLTFLEKEETNQLVNIQGNDKKIAELINRINTILINQRESKLSMRRLNFRFRQSITNLSHDLRTPLTTAGGYLEMLKDDLKLEGKNEYIDIIMERQEMVRMLLEQLFEYARIESGEIVYAQEKIDAKRILIDVLTMYYEDFSKRKMEPEIILPDCNMYICGDEKGLKRVFSNIVFNAVIHGGGDYVFCGKEQNEGYEFVFANASEVLKKEEVECLFDRFYTKDASRNGKTTGLGLAIAKEISLRFQGKIYALYRNNRLEIHVWYPKFKEDS